MKFPPKIIAAAALVLSAVSLAAYTSTHPDPAVAKRAVDAKQMLTTRERHIDPRELLALMHNKQVKSVLIDVRSESDFNQFHLVDARRVDRVDGSDAPWLFALAPDVVAVVMSNDELRANQLWQTMRSRGKPNAYVLEGGINRWLGTFAPEQPRIQARADELGFSLTAATGQSHPAARPEPSKSKQPEYTPKIKFNKPLGKVSGGCGG